MTKQIFGKAREYNFDLIRDYIEAGGKINICNEKGVSLFACFVEGYLMEAYEYEEEVKKEHFALHDEYDYDFWDSYVYDFQITPLQKRRHNIRFELEYLLEKGADPNLCKLVNGMTETALSYAACWYQDYYLTEFLLEHGADPNVWLFDESERFGKEKEEFLIEHMDIVVMNSHGDKAVNAVNIAKLLWKNGQQHWQGGLCIDVDPEMGVIGGHPLMVKY